MQWAILGAHGVQTKLSLLFNPGPIDVQGFFAVRYGRFCLKLLSNEELKPKTKEVKTKADRIQRNIKHNLRQ